MNIKIKVTNFQITDFQLFFLKQSKSFFQAQYLHYNDQIYHCLFFKYSHICYSNESFLELNNQRFKQAIFNFNLSDSFHIQVKSINYFDNNAQKLVQHFINFYNIPLCISYILYQKFNFNLDLIHFLLYDLLINNFYNINMITLINTKLDYSNQYNHFH